MPESSMIDGYGTRATVGCKLESQEKSSARACIIREYSERAMFVGCRGMVVEDVPESLMIDGFGARTTVGCKLKKFGARMYHTGAFRSCNVRGTSRSH